MPARFGRRCVVANTTFAADHLIVANAGGTNSLFQLQPNPFPVYKQVAGAYVTANFYPHATISLGNANSEIPSMRRIIRVRAFTRFRRPRIATAFSLIPASSRLRALPAFQRATLSAAGDITGYTTPYSGATPENYTLVVFGTLTVPTAPLQEAPRPVVADLTRWVEMGARGPARTHPPPRPRARGSSRSPTGPHHWAFQPIKRPSVPAGRGRWVANPIDAFILAGLRPRDWRPIRRPGSTS